MIFRIAPLGNFDISFFVFIMGWGQTVPRKSRICVGVFDFRSAIRKEVSLIFFHGVRAVLCGTVYLLRLYNLYLFKDSFVNIKNIFQSIGSEGFCHDTSYHTSARGDEGVY